MFVVLPSILASIFMMIVFTVIIVIAVTIMKIGFSILCSKCKIKKWGLLWIPFVFGWYEGGLISCFVWKKKEPNRAFQIGWTIFHALSFLIPYICYLADTRTTVHETSGVGTVIILVVMYLTVFVKIVMRTTAMIRGGKPWTFILFGIFLAPLWAYTMVREGKALFLSEYVEKQNGKDSF